MHDPELKRYIEELHAGKEYRPTSVNILYRKNSPLEYLLIKPTKDLTRWMFPQGGIEPGEDIASAFSRELEEEFIGLVAKRDIPSVSYDIYRGNIDAEPGRKDKRGFTKGKAYFFTIGRYAGQGNLLLNEEEIDAAEWCVYKDAVIKLREGRLGKAELNIRALEIARMRLGR